MKNYYQILGLSASASDEDIKAAWRKAAMKFHPDRNKDPQAEAKFKEIKLAYETLSSPVSRREYDASLNPSSDISFGFSDDILRSFFDKMEPRANAYAHIPVSPVAVGFWVGVFGGSQSVVMWVSSEGKAKQVSVSVKLPAGVDDGERIRVATNSGEGFLQVSVLDDAVFSRDGLDLQIDLPVPFITLLQGGSVLLPHWEGDLNIQISANTRDGLRLRLANKGVKRSMGGVAQIGDLYMICRAVYPEKLSKSAKDKLNSLAAEFKKEDDKKINEWASAVRSNWS